MPVRSGPLLRQPFALFDPDTCSWRTSRLSLDLGSLPELAVTWPKRGIWGRGIACELPTSVPRTAARDSSLPLVPTPEAKLARPGIDPGGLNRTENRGTDLASAMALLPTPMAREGREGGGNGMSPVGARRRFAAGRRNLEDAAALLLPTPAVRDVKGVSARPDRVHADGTPGRPTGTQLPNAVTALLPTPRASDGEKGGPNQRGSSGDLMLPSAVAQLLPTPMANRSGHNRSPSPGAAVRPSLTRMDKLLPTPTATDANAGRNATTNRSNPNSKHHSGETLTDAFWTGPDTDPQSHGGNPSSDGQPQIPLW